MSFFGGQSKEEKARSADTASTGRAIKDIGEGQVSKGNQIFKMFKKSGKAAGDFYRSILTGDRTALNEILNPELSRVGDMAKNAKQSLLLAPRGSGARAEGFTDILNKEMSTKGDIIAGARPMAAAGLSNLMPTLGGYGSSLSGQGLAGLTGSTDINFKLNDEIEKVRARQAQLFGELGGIAGDIVGKALFPVKP